MPIPDDPMIAPAEKSIDERMASNHAEIASTKELDSREQAAIGSSGNVPEVSDDDFEEEPYMCDICKKNSIEKHH